MNFSSQQHADLGHRGLSVTRLGVITAISASVLYIFCWLGAVIGLFPVTHMYLKLFSGADQTSIAALAEGTASSLAFGFLAGVVFGLVSRALARLGRR